jgi:CheY-like chemotaxis protein
MNTRPIAVVVDDNKPFLMYLSLLLGRMNLEVLPVSNAPEALEVSRVTQPQILIMDFMMPDMDGLEALRAMREDEVLSELSVIMVSGYQRKYLQWEAFSLGCVDVLEKPIDLRRLHKAVQGCDLYPNGRRRYLRAPYEKNVVLHHHDKSYEVPSVTLSERGIFVHTKEQIPKKAHVDIDIPLSSTEILQVGGSVIYLKGTDDGEPVVTPGIAVKFDRLTLKAKERLSELVEELLISDIVAEQTEPFIKPG